jgi:hypothetical protein
MTPQQICHGLNWSNVVQRLRAQLAPDVPERNWFVMLLVGEKNTESQIVERHIVTFMLSGFGMSDARLATAVAEGFRGDPLKAKGAIPDFGPLGVLDHMQAGPAASPELAGTQWAPASKPEEIRHGIAASAARHPTRTAPTQGAGIYESLTIKSSDIGADSQTLKLTALPRPALERAFAIANSSTARFVLEIRERPMTADRPGRIQSYELEFQLEPWEANRRLEVEVRVDETDRIDISTTVGGISAPIKIFRVGDGGRQLAGWECVGLGKYEAFTDDEHRLLTRKMSRNHGEAIVNYELYRA